ESQVRHEKKECDHSQLEVWIIAKLDQQNGIFVQDVIFISSEQRNLNRLMLRFHDGDLLFDVFLIQRFQRIEVTVRNHFTHAVRQDDGNGGVVADDVGKKIKIGVYIADVSELFGCFRPQLNFFSLFFRQVFHQLVGIPKRSRANQKRGKQQ